MGVLFTIPLRRAMVVGIRRCPIRKGVAAAEILKVGHGEAVPGEPGAWQTSQRVASWRR